MMDDRNDPNRPLSPGQYERSRFSNETFTGWGLPALIGAIVLIGGLLLFGSPTNRTMTAHNDRAPVTTNAPAQTPAPAPPPATQK